MMSFPRHQQRVAVVLVMLATLIVVACETTQLIDPETGEPVWSVTPRSAVLRAINASLQLDVVDPQGRSTVVNGLSRRVLDAGVVQMDGSGRVVAAAPGTARIVFEAGSKADTATVEVRQDVATVAVTPPTQSLVVGSTQQLSSTLRDANGFAIANRAVTWGSSAAGVASVSSGGLVTAHAAGSATITAASGGRSGATALTVTATPLAAVASVEVSPTTADVQIGQTRQLAVTLRDAGGAVLTGRGIAWTTSANGVATVSTSGLVTAVAQGTVTITATSEGKSASATVTVSSVPVASVSVTPTALSITVGQTGQVTATPRDAAGNALTGRIITWTTSASGIATVSTSGLVTAVAPGSATITATSEGKTATVAVTVTSAPPTPVASVTVTPTTLSITAGQTGQVTATPRDAAGNALTGRIITWTTSASGIATISTSGLVTAVAPGSATITATSEGKTATVAVTVTSAPPTPVASVTVTPTTLSIIVGQTGQVTATPRDAAGNALTGRIITWTTSASGIATVSTSGLVTAVAPGSATITATSEGKTATVAVTVTSAPPTPVASVTVTPTTLSIIVGQTGQVTATPRDAAGNALTGRIITWTTSASGIATVSTSGLVTAVVAGNATITATSEGKTATVAVTVTAVVPAPVATVSVSPSSLSLTVGQSGQLTATLRDAAGGVLTGRAVTWTTSASGVATVSGGLVTAVSQGTATLTATSEGKSGTAGVTVTASNPGQPGYAAEPVFSASNPDHRLHVQETWANLTSINNLDTQTRSDGGRPWYDRGAKRYGTVVNQGDGFGSVRHVSLDYVVDPPIPPHGSGAHAAGYHWAGAGTGTFDGDDNAVGSGKMNRGFDLDSYSSFLNTPSREAVVYEWAVRIRGTNFWDGKKVDINSGSSNRFNYEAFSSYLGIGGTSNCSDALCRLYYSNNGYTPLRSGLPPTHSSWTPSISRSGGSDLSSASGASTHWIKQNMGFGTGAGQFAYGAGPRPWGGNETDPNTNADLTGTGKHMWEAGWLYYKLRITRERATTPYLYGTGRIEMWIGKTPGSLTKVMEYFGDAGQLAAGRVWVQSSPGEFLGNVHYYSLSARNYRGGAYVDLGTIRIWSHSRQ